MPLPRCRPATAGICRARQGIAAGSRRLGLRLGNAPFSPAASQQQGCLDSAAGSKLDEGNVT